MKHFLNTQDWQRAELDALLADAARFKREPLGDALKGRSIALVFFNPSMRTRTSFELGAFQLGGHAIVLQPGKDAWPIEFDLGTVMDGDTEEHIAEVARVLGRYVDLIGVRAFPKFIDWQRDREDIVLESFAKYSPVPVINMETITHPCQELAHALALQERFGTSDLRGKKYVLTWTYHPKPLNTAVANSALTIATRMGMDVTLLCPTPDYVLDQRYMGWAAQNVAESGGSLQVSHDIESAYAGADVFSDALLDALNPGINLADAFEQARFAAMLLHPDQTPWLDGNGDGIPNEIADTQAAAQHVLFPGAAQIRLYFQRIGR